MKAEERRSLYEKAIKKWGINDQVFMVFEECAELINALAKAKRHRIPKKDIITELADVAIMVEQMAYYFGEVEFRKEKERKLERLKVKLTNY